MIIITLCHSFEYEFINNYVMADIQSKEFGASNVVWRSKEWEEKSAIKTLCDYHAWIDMTEIENKEGYYPFLSAGID